MSDVARASPASWRIRAGIHVGPVVAGVVGRTKFSFDLWGDTVNVAARLVGLGVDDAVYLSAVAFERVRGRCRAAALGRVPLKGKGDLTVYRCDGAFEEPSIKTP